MKSRSRAVSQSVGVDVPAHVTLENKNDLKHFLQLTGPQWSRADITRVIDKLKLVGCTDPKDLIHRAAGNTINEDFVTRGLPRFSRDTLENIKRQASFVKALDSDVQWPTVKQVGMLAPLPQLLSTRRLADVSMRRSKSAHGGRSSRSDSGSPQQGMASSFSEGFPSDRSSSGSMMRLRWAKSNKADRRRTEASVCSGSTTEPVLKGITDGGSSTSWSTPDASPGAQSGLGQLFHRDVVESPRSPGLPLRARSGSLAAVSAPMSRRHRSASRPEASPDRTLAVSSRFPTPPLGRSSSFGPTVDVRALAFLGSEAGSDAGLPEPLSYEEVASLQRNGQSMSRGAPLAKWMRGRRKSPLKKGEDMLREQEALDDQARLIRGLVLNEASPMRTHIASNILSRIQNEPPVADGVREAKHRLQNIQKNLEMMGKSRRELMSLRNQVQSMVQEPDERIIDRDLELKLFGKRDPVSVALKNQFQQQSSPHF